MGTNLLSGRLVQAGIMQISEYNSDLLQRSEFVLWEAWSEAIYHDLELTVFRSDPLREVEMELRKGTKTWHPSNFLSEKGGPVSMTFS